ncbi:MAG: DNA lyase, partial [Candidatus Omnitrophota bacterium]|nr:DNA lyase [Candidatus Omnitrophota bacterium]
ELKKTGLLFNGQASAIKPKLNVARFWNQKSKYLVYARKLLKKGNSFCVKPHIDESDIIKTRDWLVKNIKGFGYKEASHFLRNIGFGRDIAILDSHILKNLKTYSVIDEVPKTLTKKRYLEIEDKMRKFSRGISIPMDALDLLFWSRETGFVFK